MDTHIERRACRPPTRGPCWTDSQQRVVRRASWAQVSPPFEPCLPPTSRGHRGHCYAHYCLHCSSTHRHGHTHACTHARTCAASQLATQSVRFSVGLRCWLTSQPSCVSLLVSLRTTSLCCLKHPASLHSLLFLPLSVRLSTMGNCNDGYYDPYGNYHDCHHHHHNNGPIQSLVRAATRPPPPTVVYQNQPASYQAQYAPQPVMQAQPQPYYATTAAAQAAPAATPLRYEG